MRKAELAQTLGTQAHTPPDATALAGLADQLDEILATESPELAKELLRLLIKEIRVHDRCRIVPTYRVPATVRAMPRKVGQYWARTSDPQLVDSERCSRRLAGVRSRRMVERKTQQRANASANANERRALPLLPRCSRPFRLVLAHRSPRR